MSETLDRFLATIGDPYNRPTYTVRKSYPIVGNAWSAVAKKNSKSASPVDVNGIIAQLQLQQSQARATNERRYREIDRGYDNRYRTAMNTLAKMGGQQVADARLAGESAKAAAYQDLVSRGLRGSTVAPTVAAGVDRQTAAQVARIQDMLLSQQLAYQSQLSGDRLAFQERREDAYPDIQAILPLLMQLASLQGV